MTWRITKDHIDAGRAGTTEEHTRIPLAAAVIGLESEPLPSTQRHGEHSVEMPVIPFRLYDDDGELYYEGVLHDDDECLNQEAALSFGATDAGCTTIKVKRAGVWTQEIG